MTSLTDESVIKSSFFLSVTIYDPNTVKVFSKLIKITNKPPYGKLDFYDTFFFVSLSEKNKNILIKLCFFN